MAKQLHLIAYIKELEIEVVPGWKDFGFENVVISARQKLPALFRMGKQWTIKHQCDCCDKMVETTYHVGSLTVHQENFFQLGYLINSQRPDDYIDNIAAVFKNLKEGTENGRRRYVLHGNNKEIGKVLAQVFYYTCFYCNAKYLATYCCSYGEDGDGGGTIEPNYVYIEEVANVEGSEAAFLART